MEIAFRRECGCVIHELSAGIDEKFSGDREDANRNRADGPVGAWDPVRKQTMYSGPQQRYSRANEEREAAAAAARDWAKYPPEAGFPNPAERIGAGGWKEDGDPRGGKRKGNRKRGKSGLSDGETFDLGQLQRQMEVRKVTAGEFRGAIRAGGFRAVHLVAQGPFFLIQGEPHGPAAKAGRAVDDSAWLTLVTTRGRKSQMFLNPTTALALLKRIGVKSVQVDMESWRPNQPTDNERRRPDMVERLRFAHEYAREGGEALVEGS